jgi:hypothetical protein
MNSIDVPQYMKCTRCGCLRAPSALQPGLPLCSDVSLCNRLILFLAVPGRTQ